MDNVIEPTVVEVKENIQQNNEVKETKEAIPNETQEQINWKKFREAREQERKQKEAAESGEEIVSHSHSIAFNGSQTNPTYLTGITVITKKIEPE